MENSVIKSTKNVVVYVNDKLQKVVVDTDFNIINTDLIYKFPVNSRTSESELNTKGFNQMYYNN